MIRVATHSDLERILSIYERARIFMRENGNPEQWKTSYPSREIVQSDIDSGFLHVYESSGEIEAVFALLEGGDPIYEHIDGAWIDRGEYAAVHRVASAGRARGAGRRCLQYACERHRSVRIDTHRDNAPMQGLLLSMGFQHCGTVYTETGEERLAFQYVR